MFRGLVGEKRVPKYSDRELYRRYLKRLIPFKRSILLIVLFILLLTTSDIFQPLMVGFAVDEFEKINPSFFFIVTAGTSYLILRFIQFIAFFLHRRELGKFTPFFLEQLRLDVFDKIQEEDMSFYDTYQSAELNTRISNDALDFANTIALIADFIGNVVISFITFGILIWLNPMLSIITAISIPFIVFSMIFLRKLSRKVSIAYRKAIESVNGEMVEAIEGIQVSKSYGQETTISDNFEKTNENYFKTNFRMTSVTHSRRPLVSTISSITLLIIIFLGTMQISDGLESAGTILMYILYLQRFFRPILILSNFFPQLASGMAAFERILEIMDYEPRVKQNPTAVDVNGLNGVIEFENVDFSYNEGQWILKNFNLKIAKGEKLAVVGQTGAGKTSLVALLARYYEFQNGTIKIDGRDIRDMTLKSYRRNLGMVEQDSFLFWGTIEENIKYGRQDATEEDVMRAIKAVHAEEFIEYLPEGIKTQVGERGKGLSMGQRQLVSFARALLTDPKILILDEATSSVDAYTEAIIQEALEVLLSDRTSIIIAHRLSTIVNADRIIVMDGGQIIEEGSHDSLLNKGGKYSQLYKQYFEHQSLEWHDKKKV
jgi:ABC-type multidrug transport system fused ATPase/permease subunit